MLLSTNVPSATDVARLQDEYAASHVDGGAKDGLADMMQRILHQHVEPSVS